MTIQNIKIELVNLKEAKQPILTFQPIPTLQPTPTVHPTPTVQPTPTLQPTSNSPTPKEFLKILEFHLKGHLRRTLQIIP